MKHYRKLLLFIIAVFPFLANSQERGIPVYLDYLTDNYYLIHPSMAGASQHGKIRMTGRTQWFDVDDAPRLMTLSGNGRINDRIGVGGIVYNDKNGRFSQQGLYGTFAYHILMSRDELDLNQLSFGLNLGILQERLDESDLIGPGQPPDPIISGHKQKDAYINVDFGMSYYIYEFYIHATIKNLIPQKRDIFSSDLETDNQRQYLLSTGYTFMPRYSNWTLEPSIMIQYKEVTNEAIGDINGKAYYNFDWGQLWGGLSYRRSFNGADFSRRGSSAIRSQKLQYFSPFIGVNYNKFIFAYTYSHQANSVVMDPGYHQITLGYNFGRGRSGFHCSCPSINR